MGELPKKTDFPDNFKKLSSLEVGSHGMFDFESGSQELINKLENNEENNEEKLFSINPDVFLNPPQEIAEEADNMSIVSGDTHAFARITNKYDNIKVFKDIGGVRSSSRPTHNGKDVFGAWTKRPTQTAAEQFYTHYGFTASEFNAQLDFGRKWSLMCKRPQVDRDADPNDLGLRYRQASFEKAPIIIVGNDSDRTPRSYLTAGYKKHGDKIYLYIDVVCSCKDDPDFCPLRQGVVRGPGGANLIAVLLKKIKAVNNNVTNILLHATPNATLSYKGMGFVNQGPIRNDNLQPMTININKVEHL